MAEEKEKGKMLHCKFGCGAEFPCDPTGKAKLMNHYTWDCPSNPDRKTKSGETAKEKEIKVDRQERDSEVSKGVQSRARDEKLDMSEALEKIIMEASNNPKRPAVIRFVERYMDNPKKSVEVLEEALRLGDFKPSEKNLIIKNWATYLKVDNVDKLLESEKSEETLKKEEKEKSEETGDAIDKELEKMMKSEVRQLQLLRIKKERQMLERELQDPKPEPKKEEEDKVIHVIDGVQLKVTPQEKLAWMRYEAEQKEKQEEKEIRRAEQKQRSEEQNRKKDDDTIEWPIGDKILKVKQETIPLLVYQQTQKKDGDSDAVKALMEEMKQQREQMHNFQLEVLKKEIDELKAYAGQDPLDRLFTQKKRLEELGIVQSGKATAQERLYDMDSKKLDTLLKIVVDKSSSTQSKVDSLLSTIGPVAQDYIKEMILNMKQGRGVLAPEVPRTDQQTAETLTKLEEIDKAMDAVGQKVVSVGKPADAPVQPEAK